MADLALILQNRRDVFRERDRLGSRLGSGYRTRDSRDQYNRYRQDDTPNGPHIEPPGKLGVVRNLIPSIVDAPTDAVNYLQVVNVCAVLGARDSPPREEGNTHLPNKN
jgi:hypothetical protein